MFRNSSGWNKQKNSSVKCAPRELTLSCMVCRETINTPVYVSSVQSLSHVDSLRPHELQHARPPCPSPTPRVHPDSRPSSQWCHPAISSSVVPFSSCPQSLPASESFPMSQQHQTQVKIKCHPQLFIHRLLTNYRQGSKLKLTLKDTDLRGKHLAPRAECNFMLAESNHIYLWFYYL